MSSTFSNHHERIVKRWKAMREAEHGQENDKCQANGRPNQEIRGTGRQAQAEQNTTD